MSKIKTIPFTEQENEQLAKVYAPFREPHGQRYVRTDPGNCVIPAAYEKFKEKLENWQFRTDDVYVFAFPKSGTTWTQELVWCVQNDCNFTEAKATMISERVPFIEFPMIIDFVNHQLKLVPDNFYEILNNIPSPRILKSHLPFCLLPSQLLDTCKIVLCIRNPKDAVVSYYHHDKLLKHHGYTGDFASYFDLFMTDKIMFTPYFPYVVEAWKRRDHPNLCLIFYEDMKKDQDAAIRKVAKFLGKDLSEDKIKSLVQHLDFKCMKQNKAVNYEFLTENPEDGSFMRKGQVGDWKNYFTEEMNARMDDAIKKYCTPIGLEFTCE
eukprot:Seg2813.2 transcript_id=Seg2813.2/GoldUCD/mRNA.D3Y31 product="Sulfotransferase 1C4" protein_id=Seg2813.2/GoldUCD/D3Y31